MIVGWFSIFCRNDGEGEKRNEFFLDSDVSVTVDEKITEYKQADVFRWLVAFLFSPSYGYW
jgi:hypothetical protein